MVLIAMLLGTYCQASACAWEYTNNYYLFSAFHRDLMKERFIDITNRNWLSYMGRPESDPFNYLGSRDEVKAYAQKQGDQDMLTYLKWLDIYLDDNGIFEGWEYPTKQQLARRNAHLRQMLNVAVGYKGRMRSQYGLMRMRAHFGLKQYSQCISFWEQTAVNYRQTVYKEMMRNIYAGALCRTGKAFDGINIYADQQDFLSLKYYVRHQRNLSGIYNAVDNHYNSSLLSYLVQDFVNNAQETMDALKDEYRRTKPQGIDSDLENRLRFVDAKGVYMEDIDGFMELADRMTATADLPNKALWYGAKGTLEYLLGRYPQASSDLAKAMADHNSEQRLLDNARAVKILADVHQGPDDEQKLNKIAQELEWLDAIANEDCLTGNDCSTHYTDVKIRFVHQELVPLLERMGRRDLAAGMLGELESHDEDDLRYYDHYFKYLWSMHPDKLAAYVNWLSRNKGTGLEAYILKSVKRNENYYNDLVGTRYLAQGNFEKAIKWLQEVYIDFQAMQNIAPYTRRNYNVDRWYTKQKIREEELWNSSYRMSESKKLAYCRAILQEESIYRNMREGLQKRQQAYKLASLYYQASYEGDCWWLTQYEVSAYQTKPNEGTFDFVGRAVELLDEAALAWNEPTKVFGKKFKGFAETKISGEEYDLMLNSIYARAFIKRDPWMKTGWDEDRDEWIDSDKPLIMKESRQYKALSDMWDFRLAFKVYSGPMGRCDVLKEFEKYI